MHTIQFGAGNSKVDHRKDVFGIIMKTKSKIFRNVSSFDEQNEQNFRVYHLSKSAVDSEVNVFWKKRVVKNFEETCVYVNVFKIFMEKAHLEFPRKRVHN